MGVGTIGALGKLAIHSASTAQAGDRIDYKTCNFGSTDQFTDFNGARGTLSPHITRNRQTQVLNRGNLMLQPSAAEWAKVLPWILGANVASGVYNLADTAIALNVTRDEGDGEARVYSGCGVVSARFASSEGQALSVDLDIIGRSKGDATTFPNIDIEVTTQPFVFSDATISIGGVSMQFKEFELMVDNKVDTTRFLNSLYLTTIQKLDRIITFKCKVPKKDYLAEFDAIGVDTGAAVSLTFTNGLTSILFEMPHVALPKRKPEESGRGVEAFFPFEGQCFAGGVNNVERELKITLDANPDA